MSTVNFTSNEKPGVPHCQQSNRPNGSLKFVCGKEVALEYLMTTHYFFLIDNNRG